MPATAPSTAQSTERSDPLQSDPEAAPQTPLLKSAPGAFGGLQEVLEEVGERILFGPQGGPLGIVRSPGLRFWRVWSSKHRGVWEEIPLLVPLELLDLHRQKVHGADVILHQLL